MKPQTNRVAYLDMLKCLGMFIVVQGHIHPDYGWFSLPIHSYVIPLYFLLSGLTFRREKFPTFGTFAAHRAKTLLLPYAMFSVLTWAFWAAYNTALHNPVDLWGPLLQTLFAQGSGTFLVHNVPLWFIPCLFVIESMYYFIDKLSVRWNVVVCVACAFIGVWMITGAYSNIFKLLPWSIESAFAAIIFYCTGNVLTKYRSLKQIEEAIVAKKVIAIASIAILTPILVYSSYWNGHISLGSDLLGRSPILFYINAFIGIVTIFLFSVLICNIKWDSKLWKWIIDYHLFFGRNSFYIMATHVPVKGIIMVGIAGLLHKSVGFVSYDYLCCAIVFAVTCAICSVLALLIGKQKQIDHQLIEKLRNK